MKLDLPEAKTQTVNMLQKVGLRIAASWLFINITSYLLLSIPKIKFKYSFNYVEGMVADPILRIAKNPWLYDSIYQEPFVLNPYHPLYHYCSFLLMQWTGGVFLAPRIVSFISCLLLACILYGVLRRMSLKPLESAMVSGLFLTVPLAQSHSVQARPDFLALLWVWLGIYFVLRYEQKSVRRLRGLLYPVLFFCLAFWTKQNFVLASLSYALYLLLNRRWSEWRTYCIYMLLGTVPIWFALAIGTHGNFTDHTLSLMKTQYMPKLLLIHWRSFIVQYWILIPPALLAFVPRYWKSPRAYLLIYGLLSALSTLSVGKTGFDLNHFLELTVISIILCGLGLFSSIHRVGFKGYAWIFLCVGIMFYSHAVPSFNFKTNQKLTQTSQHIDEMMLPLKNIPGKIISENIGVLAALNLPIWYEPFGYRQLAFLGIFDEAVVLRKLQTGEYQLLILNINPGIILESSRFSRTFLEYVRQYYVIVGRRQGNFFLMHKSYVRMNTQKKAN